ncbi:MAG: head-tail connector protein [Ferrovibrio sp.]|uniref:head-tail connector protein n=1 Tax=Ferrovibrio sp. TaxID=1917215 RepID=UPI00262E468F|nr:head-tail connector protein [Ferrovibrio sp.]MCW0235273.1 head-tail connector protein [Ferrovibrio sp.]
MLSVVTAPIDDVVSLPDAKRHLRVDYDDDDAYIASLVGAAVANIDGPEGWLGRALGEQSLVLTLDAFPCGRRRLSIPLPPLVSVEAVSYIDGSGTEQSLAGFRVFGVGAPYGGYVLPPLGQDWPRTHCDPGSVTVEFTAGYGNGIPAPVRHAILLMIGHWFRNREAVEDAKLAELPMGVAALLNPLRVWR